MSKSEPGAEAAPRLEGHPNRRVEATRFRGMSPLTTSAEFGAIGGAMSSMPDVQEHRRMMKSMRMGTLTPEQHAVADSIFQSKLAQRQADKAEKQRQR